MSQNKNKADRCSFRRYQALFHTEVSVRRCIKAKNSSACPLRTDGGALLGVEQGAGLAGQQFGRVGVERRESEPWQKKLLVQQLT
jgi:hypothetical protein